jgi:hypothetical protein
MNGQAGDVQICCATVREVKQTWAWAAKLLLPMCRSIELRVLTLRTRHLLPIFNNEGNSETTKINPPINRLGDIASLHGLR